MTAVTRVAIAGAGIAGTSAAILLAEQGIHVDLYEPKAGISPLGSGITLQGNALRVFDRLGVWDRVKQAGYASDVLGIRAPGPIAPVVATIPDAPTGGPNYPATVGMYRPELAQFFAERAEQVGVNFVFNTGVVGFTADDDGVDVELSTGETARYDLLIGADGINSGIRSLMGIETKPERTGMGIWRAFVKRPAEVTNTDLIYGGPVYIAGYCPTSEDMMYAYVVEDWQDRSHLTPEEGVAVMRGIAENYGGPWNEIVTELTPESASRVNYTAFTTHLVTAPWNRGRVVIIGDAAHSCPPTVAQGAAQASEDALVLADVLTRHDAVDQAMWDEFHERRIPRATTIVEASVQLGQWQLDHVEGDVPGLMRRVAETVMPLP